jgi:hypothetical protein
LAAQRVFDNLIRSYNVEKAREAGKDFVEAYTKAWESGSILRAAAVAIRFADATKISFQDAINILDELMRKIEKSTEAVESTAYDWQNLGGRGPEIGIGPGQIMPTTLLGKFAQYAADAMATIASIAADESNMLSRGGVDFGQGYLGHGNVTDTIIEAGSPMSYYFEFHAPLVTVIGGGGGNQQNLKMVAGMIQESLKRVVIEASSASAPTSEKQIRISSNVGVPGVQMATQVSTVGTLLRMKLAEGRAY